MDELLMIRTIDGDEYIGLTEKTETTYILENPLAVTSDPMTGGIGMVDPLILSEQKHIEIPARCVLYEYKPSPKTVHYYFKSYKYYTSEEYISDKHAQMDMVIERFEDSNYKKPKK